MEARASIGAPAPCILFRSGAAADTVPDL